MSAGRNGAVLLTVRREDGTSAECVVKLTKGMAADQAAMTPLPYLCEWLAAAVGRALGIRVAAPYEVNISRQFADALADPRQRTVALGSLGSAFGSEHFSVGASQYTLDLPDPSLRTPAAELAAFDVYIHNVDRRKVNPNLFVSRSELLAFDHGDAFSFVHPILFAPDPVTDALEKCVEAHACRPWLHKREFSLDRFRQALTTLTDQVFSEIEAATPVAWTSGVAAGKLRSVIDVLRQRRDAVEQWLPQVEAGLAR